MDEGAIERRITRLEFSRRLSILLALGVCMLIAVVATTSIWMARQHDALAAEATKRMVIGAIAAQREKLATIIRDYSIWDDAYDAILADNIEWMAENIGAGASDAGTTDLMIILAPGGVEYGWSAAAGQSDPQAGLLSAEAIASVLGPLDAMPLDDIRSVTAFTRSNGELWLLSAMRVLPAAGAPAGVTDAEIPRHVFAFLMSEERMASIGASFLIDDLSVEAEAAQGRASLPLSTADGATIGYATWAPTKPGATILNRISPPLILALVMISLVGLFASRHLVRSATRLEQALAADRSKTDFLANVGHELRTPMNGVIGIGQLLAESGLTAAQRELLDILLSSARSQLTLIDELMDISRIESGKMALDLAPFSPEETIAEVVALATPKAKEKGLDLRLELPDQGGPPILGDRDAFKQIFTNLIGNAIKFTASGSVQVTMDQALGLDEMALTIAVADSGPGIAAKDHAFVFDRFAQIDGAKARINGGMGLGLSITKALVEQMRGEIDLQSASGEGATFTVRMNFELAHLVSPEAKAEAAAA